MLLVRRIEDRLQRVHEIKDCQLDLFANRMSAHAHKANQLRLLLAAFTYVLIDGIRRVALKKTTLACDSGRSLSLLIKDITASPNGYLYVSVRSGRGISAGVSIRRGRF